jgi:hypothetical protein
MSICQGIEVGAFTKVFSGARIGTACNLYGHTFVEFGNPAPSRAEWIVGRENLCEFQIPVRPVLGKLLIGGLENRKSWRFAICAAPWKRPHNESQ